MMPTPNFDFAIKKSKTELMDEIFQLQELIDEMEKENNVLRTDLTKAKTMLHFVKQLYTNYQA